MNTQPKPAEFVTVTPTMRGLIENVIEDLMLLLDEIDGDADLEDGGDSEAPSYPPLSASQYERRSRKSIA